MARRTLVIGDIHGCLAALEAVLNAAGASRGDTLVVLGDSIDRGPDSPGVIERLLGFKETGTLVPLRGNHEVMMLQAMDGERDGLWLRAGGRMTLERLGFKGVGPWRSLIPRFMADYLRNECLDYWETGGFIMTHAGIEAGLSLSDQPESTLYWNSLEGDPAPHFSGKTAIHGHTIMPCRMPWAWPFAWYLDTGSYLADGWLTCVDIGTRDVWQANQKGQSRTGQWVLAPVNGD